MSSTFITIILAAGLGKRMNSDLPKVLHTLAGRALVHYVIDQARAADSERIILVVGHKRELVIAETSPRQVQWAVQERQLGTADAVKSCIPALEGCKGDILILSGDVPLLRSRTIQEAWALHLSTRAAATVFTFLPPNPQGYGRILRGNNQELLQIKEDKDADEKTLMINEVNGGVYFFKWQDLRLVLPLIRNDNKAQEYYITDAIKLLRDNHKQVSAFLVKDAWELSGVNSPQQLQELEAEYIRRQDQSS